MKKGNEAQWGPEVPKANRDPKAAADPEVHKAKKENEAQPGPEVFRGNEDSEENRAHGEKPAQPVHKAAADPEVSKDPQALMEFSNMPTLTYSATIS